jgi:hypothetical protein
MRYDDKYLDDAANLTHLRKVLVELDTICDTAIGQEIDYKIFDAVEKDAKERLAKVEKKLYDQLVQPRAGVAPTGTKQKRVKHKRALARNV